MSLSQLRKEINELKYSFIEEHEPIHKVFILRVKDSPTEAEIEAYSQAHPYTKIIKLTRKSCRKAF